MLMATLVRISYKFIRCEPFFNNIEISYEGNNKEKDESHKNERYLFFFF